MNRLSLIPFFALATALSSASPYVIDAYLNSSSGGSAVSTISLASGQQFIVSVPTSDLWSAGGLPRWSNADGLVGDLYATGSDESGLYAGALIGQSFGTYTQDGFTAPYGALVGRIGGNYMLLGTSFSGVAPSSGTLELMYWDSNNGDNSEHVTANVQAVPEPASLAALGLGALGILKRRRRA